MRGLTKLIMMRDSDAYEGNPTTLYALMLCSENTEISLSWRFAMFCIYVLFLVDILVFYFDIFMPFWDVGLCFQTLLCPC